MKEIRTKVLVKLVSLTSLSLVLLTIGTSQACDPWCTDWGHSSGCDGHYCTGCHGYGSGVWIGPWCVGGSGNKVCRLGAFQDCTWNLCGPRPCTPCNGGPIQVAGCGMDTNKCPSSCADGAECEIRGGNCCDFATTGVWDNSQGKCIKCSGKSENLIYATTATIYTSGNGDAGAIAGNSRCEVACGAASVCDEVRPGDSGCIDCTTSTIITSTTTTTTTSYSSTTTTATVDLTCSGSTSHQCSTTYKSINSIDSITVASTANCGDTIPVTVYWTGKHNTNDNHWGFFIDSTFTDSCKSYAYDSGTNSYKMSCNVRMPTVGSVTNGAHTFTVTGEDYGGYCNPGESGVDAQKSGSITLNNCISTTTTTTTTTTTAPIPIIYNIECSGTTNYGCNAPQNSIDSIDSITIPSSVNCGDRVNVAVRWTGYHLGDSNHWGFFINNSGQFIHLGDCTSFVSGDAPHTMYNMSCYVNMPNNGDINGGTYDFWVTGSDTGGYCNPGDYGTHVESFVPITLNCGVYTPPCSQCRNNFLTSECRAVCNNPKEPSPIKTTRCKCQSFQEWYLYDVTSTNFEVWINAIPTSNIDVSLYSTSDKSCPTTSSYNCFNNTGGPGQTEMCHFKLGEMDSPQYFFVNKVGGPVYDLNNYYDIMLTCIPDSSDTGSSGQGMLLDVPPPANDKYYKFNPIPGKTVSVTLTPDLSNDYNLYLSKSPSLYPFLEKDGTKNYVCYGDKVSYGGKEKCTFTVPNSGNYYYLVHHARGGYGYDITWDYSCPGDVDNKIINEDGVNKKIVQLTDLVKFAVAYDSKAGDSKWDPDADLNADYKVNLQDLVTLAVHYGWKYSTDCIVLSQ
jgi:hypothetical protein